MIPPQLQYCLYIYITIIINVIIVIIGDSDTFKKEKLCDPKKKTEDYNLLRLL